MEFGFHALRSLSQTRAEVVVETRWSKSLRHIASNERSVMRDPCLMKREPQLVTYHQILIIQNRLTSLV